MPKPKSVCTTITIKNYGDETLPVRIKQLMNLSTRDMFLIERRESRNGRPLANDDYPIGESLTYTLEMGCMVSSVLIGAIHLAAW